MERNISFPFSLKSVDTHIVFREMKKIVLIVELLFSAGAATGQTNISLQSVSNVALPSNSAPSELVVLDINHDSRADLAIAQGGVNSIAIYRQDISGGFANPAVIYPVGTSPSGLVATDLDYTGAVDDLIAICKGDGSFYALTNSNQPSGALTVGPTNYYYGPDPGTNPRIAVGYIDRDTRPDLLVGLTNNLPGMVSWNYQGLGNWVNHGLARTNAPISSVLIQDLDGDSFADIAAALPSTSQVKVFRHDGTNGAFPYLLSMGSPVLVPTVGLGPVDVVAVDINQDSRPDLLTANADDNTVSLLLGTGGARFGAAILVSQSAAPRRVLAADLNGDRRPELLTINADNTLNVYENTGLSGPNRFSTPLTLPTGLNPIAMRVADFNGDGKLDVAVACAGDNTVRLYYNATALSNKASSAQAMFSIFPNPASNEVRIQLKSGAVPNLTSSASIYDLAGRLLTTQVLRSSSGSLNVEALPRGVYILCIANGNYTYSKRLVLN